MAAVCRAMSSRILILRLSAMASASDSRSCLSMCLSSTSRALQSCAERKYSIPSSFSSIVYLPDSLA